MKFFELKNKKGQLGNLQQLIMVLVFIGILIGAGFLVMEEFRGAIGEASSEGVNSTAYKGVNKTIEAAYKIPLWLGIIVILVIVGILLTILFNVFPRTGAGGQV